MAKKKNTGNAGTALVVAGVVGAGVLGYYLYDRYKVGGGGGESPPAPLPKYKLFLSVVPAYTGDIEVSPKLASYDKGSLVTVTAKPSSNHKFSGWLLKTGVITGANFGSATMAFKMNGDVSLQANFEYEDHGEDPIIIDPPTPGDPEYTLSAEALEGGVITVLPERDVYLKNTMVSLVATPNTFYKFSRWNILFGAIDYPVDKSKSNISFPMTGDLVMTASFTYDPPDIIIPPPDPDNPAYTLSITADGGGSISVNPSQESYLENTWVGVNAIPSAGYSFKQWNIISGDMGIFNDRSSPAMAFPMVSDLVLHAEFIYISPTVTGGLEIIGDAITWSVPSPLIGDQWGHASLLVKNGTSISLPIILYMGVNYIDYSGQSSVPPVIQKTLASGQVSVFEFDFRIPGVPHSATQTFKIMAIAVSGNFQAQVEAEVTVYHKV
jgi:hypothetical protein